LGAFIAPLVTGFLAQSETFKDWLNANGFDPTASWHWGFGAAGVGMLIGIGVFLLQRGRLGDVGDAPAGGTLAIGKTLGVLGGTGALMGLVLLSDQPGFTGLRLLFIALPLLAIVYFARKADLDARKLAAVFVFFMAAMVFWALFEQAGFTLALFADQQTDTKLFGWAFPSAWFQSLNPLFVILLAPVFAWGWVAMGARQPTSGIKFTIGLACLALSYVLMVPAAVLTVTGKVSPLWLIGLFFLQTVGELCLSPVGLATMTRLAPPSLVGLVLGLWFLAAALGSKIAALLGSEFASNDPSELAVFFGVLAGLATVAAGAMWFVSPWLNRLMGLEKTPSGTSRT
jgi:proton-dependent oligopeptide transporter, POT family